jgi:hypothetical protein
MVETKIDRLGGGGKKTRPQQLDPEQDPTNKTRIGGITKKKIRMREKVEE